MPMQNEILVGGQPIPEVDVICEVAIWLCSNGWQVERVTLPHGQGISQQSIEKTKSKLEEAGISRDRVSQSQGPDIVARTGDEEWKIECKGLGNVAPGTLKNNFDRAVASAVSYYTDKEGLRIGLAMPEVVYDKYLRGKLPQALKEAIKLWIFIYVAADNKVYAFGPREEFWV